MTSVRLEIPESKVVALVGQLSPGAKQAALQMLLSELEVLDELVALEDYDEFLEYWQPSEDWDEGGGMAGQQLLAAETFHYSYANYASHLGIGNIRFDELMPNDVDTLERAEQEGWDDSRLAQALDVEEGQVGLWRRSYERAKQIVDAPTPAESFRRGVRFSTEDAVEDGLADEQAIEKLVEQICYRAADLAYLLDMRPERLSDYSKELRKVSHSGLD